MSKHLEPGKHYVCGFVFDPSYRNVLLIRKKRPEWQAGKLNGVGGKVEKGETILAAMSREFTEETGLTVRDSAWYEYAELRDKRGWFIHFFYAVHLTIGDYELLTDEHPEICATESFGNIRFMQDGETIPNLNWLIPMAMSMRFESIKKFIIQED